MFAAAGAAAATGAWRRVPGVGRASEGVISEGDEMIEPDVSCVVEPLTLAQREAPPPVPTGELAAEPVPEAARPLPVALVRILLPLVMIAAMLGIVALLVIGGGQGRRISPMSLLFPLMMGMGMLTMFGSSAAGADPDEARRTYLRHLGALRAKAEENGRAQRAHEEFRNPSPRHLFGLVGTARMWERAGTDPDALEVRIGTGPAPLCTPVSVPDPGAAEDLDPVCAVSVRRTVRAVSTLAGMPVVVQLQAFRYVSIAGPGAAALARAMIMQLATAHGPEALGLRWRGERWEWMKWLPHARAAHRARHTVAVVAADCGVEEVNAGAPLCTIIGVNPPPGSPVALRAELEGICLVCGEDLRVVTEAGEEVVGLGDAASPAAALLLARSMARYRRPRESGGEPGRGEGDLLSLLGYHGIEDFAARQLWPGRSESSRLSVPVGIDGEGRAVYVDLKESAHGGMGPHGLCIGATGSGKSELLRTLVAALTATHSPAELNLVLVDFKGGATFLGCESLPHTAAVITNLENEATLVERMYDAISGEMNRRQEFLRAAGNFANVTDYNAARGEGDPLPALVIVIDEFSELLGQHPDFADLFVAVGRLGRSLHVHLLLASQRLEEGRLRGLESHLSYRIGLKTFSAAESRQVLGVTDAYHLPAQPGSGYLKTDAEDIKRFQAAYVSGPVTRRVDPAPARGGEGSAASARRVALFEGWEEESAAAAAPDSFVLDSSTTLLAEIVSAARAEAATRGEQAHRLWLPPLPEFVELPAVLSPLLKEETLPPLSVAVGIIDRPYYQRQDPFVLDLNRSGGHVAVCGGPQTGKSTLLRTVVVSLAARHGPDKVRFYVIDLGGGQLSALARLPHVAAVAGRGEAEKIRRIVDEVAGLIRRPEERETFLIIDGWHHIGITGADYEDLAEAITVLAADGPSARVHVAVSASRWTALRPAIRDLIATRVELRLGESMDSLIDRKAQQRLPAAAGHGLTEGGEHMLVATASNEDIAHVARLHAHLPAVPQLKMLPRVLSSLPPAAPGTIAWGRGGPDLEVMAWEPQRDPHLVCIGSQGAGKSTFLSTIMRGIGALPRASARLVVVDERRAHLGSLAEEMLAAYSATSTATREAIAQTVHTLSERLPGAQVTPAQLAARSWWTGPEIFLVIDDLELVSEAALSPLVELLPHARDIGLHLVIARKAGGIGRALFGQFLSAVRDLQPAVVLLDADRDEGAIFGIKPSRQPPGRGHYSVRGENLGIAQVAQLAPGSADKPRHALPPADSQRGPRAEEFAREANPQAANPQAVNAQQDHERGDKGNAQ